MKRGDRWWLVAEPSIECYDLSSWNQHTQLLPVCCVAMIVYVAGIPILFGSLLFRRRKVRWIRHSLSVPQQQQHVLPAAQSWQQMLCLCRPCVGECAADSAGIVLMDGWQLLCFRC